MATKVIAPKFSEVEIGKIDKIVDAGEARCRSDFVRIATLAYIWGRENREGIT